MKITFFLKKKKPIQDLLKQFNFKESIETIIQELDKIGIVKLEQFQYLDKDLLLQTSLSPVSQVLLLKIKENPENFSNLNPEFLQNVQV